MHDHTCPIRALAVLTLCVAVALAAVAGHLVGTRDLLASVASGLTMNLVEQALRTVLAGAENGPGPDGPPADAEPPEESPR